MARNKNLLIVRLMGGLGNQLFQYAAGRSLALSHQLDLMLDLAFFQRQSLRSYALSDFQVVEEFATGFAAILGDLWRPRPLRPIARTLHRMGSRWGVQYIADQQCGFDERLRHISGNAYLDGYWQSEKYFAEHQEVIRREFRLRSQPDSASQSILAAICDAESVCVHCRRGDYVSNPHTNAVHGTCEPDYYQRAIAIIRERVCRPEFFVFSDDPDWARGNLGIPSANYVTQNLGKRDCEDMRLMSYCKHFVIANSSFSWWGAWLSPNPGKVVVAPKRWFQGSWPSSQDLIPDAWLTT